MNDNERRLLIIIEDARSLLLEQFRGKTLQTTNSPLYCHEPEWIDSKMEAQDVVRWIEQTGAKPWRVKP